MPNSSPKNVFYDEMLIDAAIENDCNKMHLALSAGANVDAKDYSIGASALAHAIHRGHNKIVKELCVNKADCNILENKSGRSPLVCAIKANNKEAFEMLVSYGADVNLVSKGGLAPMHAAILNKRDDMALRLLELGANINIRCNDKGLTPLMSATNANDRKAIKFLIDNGADCDAKDNAGQGVSLFAKLHDDKKEDGGLVQFISDCIKQRRSASKNRSIKKHRQVRHFVNRNKPF